MKRLIILFAVMIPFIFAGCVPGPHSMLEPEKPSPDAIPSNMARESDKLDGIQKELLDSLQKTAPRNIEVEPVMPVYDPLEDHTVSFSAVDETLQTVLYSLARAVGMNIIIDPRIKDETKRVTLNFEKVSAATVLREVLNSFDLYYEVTQNIIRIKPFEEKIFALNFMDTNTDIIFDVGGDVLGAGEKKSTTGLSGNFKLSGKGAKKPNSYDVVEDMVKQVISAKGGKYSLNRLSGSLYVRDTPAVLRAIATLINQFKERMSKQILIEARIIEVNLSDGYKYGIDWDMLRNEIHTASMLNSAAWSSSGLVLSGVTGAFTSNATIKALNTFGDSKIVSNPSIRTKHGQPAVISVGTSLTYKEKVQTTRYTDSGISSRDSTEVDVSTVFDGLILGVVPFIEQNGNITLLINPIKSDVDLESLEPEGTGEESVSLPRVSIKEISTTIGLHSGDVVILGGLIDKRKIKTNKGVPFLSSIPLIGYLFKNEVMANETRELVIVLRVTIT